MVIYTKGLEIFSVAMDLSDVQIRVSSNDRIVLRKYDDNGRYICDFRECTFADISNRVIVNPSHVCIYTQIREQVDGFVPNERSYIYIGQRPVDIWAGDYRCLSVLLSNEEPDVIRARMDVYSIVNSERAPFLFMMLLKLLMITDEPILYTSDNKLEYLVQSNEQVTNWEDTSDYNSDEEYDTELYDPYPECEDVVEDVTRLLAIIIDRY